MRSLGRGTLGLSAGCHAAALALVFVVLPVLRDDPVKYEVIRVEVVSPPPAPAPPAQEETPPPVVDELVVETPEDPAPRPEAPQETFDQPDPDPVPEQLEEEQPDPDPVPEQPEEEQPDPDPAPPDPPQASPLPETPEMPPPEPAEAVQPESSAEPDADKNGEDINVRQQGMQRDFPVYWNNLIRQMKRCFRPKRRLSATVRFVVQGDGSTTDIGVAKSSGSFAFDLDAMGAAECIGKAGRLGPLPDELPWDSVPVQIELSPPGGRIGP